VVPLANGAIAAHANVWSAFAHANPVSDSFHISRTFGVSNDSAYANTFAFDVADRLAFAERIQKAAPLNRPLKRRGSANRDTAFTVGFEVFVHILSSEAIHPVANARVRDFLLPTKMTQVSPGRPDLPFRWTGTARGA
jgi:hypothetical protein